jgi:SAM-dependent methyltransferase
MHDRITREVEHGRFLAERKPGQIWNWETPAGKLRWVRRVKMLSSHLCPGMNVLELGCGIGLFTAELAKTGADVTGIDISPDLLEIARAERAAPNVHYEVQNAYATSYAGSTFETVVGSSVLHHLELESALREMHRVLKPGGTIFFTEPNMLNPQIAVQKNVPWIKRKLGDSPDETAFFRWPLRRSLERNGFREIRIEPFDFLHPAIPARLTGPLQTISRVLEKTPVIAEFAGSLYICALK